MADPVVPTPEFAPSFRGYDRTQVDRWVVKVRDRLKEVEGELSRLRNVVSDTAVHPVPEYERIGREIGALLQEADRLATSIREKAATEVEMWRADAEREAKSLRDAAAADAEAMRGDAWATSTELLEESQGRAARMVGDAEDNARGIRAEAERESHRLVAGARREADEQIRVAKMEAERVVSEALAEKDEIVESARRTAEAAQERARALEVRRDELLGELESVRATVQRLEEDIDEKRQLLEPDPEPEPSPSEPTWGGGVRVIPARDEPEAAEDFGEPVETMAVVEEVIRLREPEAGGGHVAVVATEPEPEPEPEPGPGPGPERETETDPEPEPELETDPEPETERELKPDLAPAAESGDELSALFSSLRGADEVEANEEVVAEESSGSAVGGPTPPAARERSSAGSDRLGDVEAAVEVRQRAVLPISNGALRGVKRELADAQNGALEALRTTQDWAPSQSELADRFEPILSSVRSDAFAAGWASAGGPGEPVGTPSNDRSAFAGDLVGSLVRALGKGADASAKSTEVSRAFRGWRSDSSERHLRAEAVLAFNEGVHSAIAASGTGAGIAVRSRGCSACRAAAEEGLGAVPPFHADCSCVVVPA